MIPYHGEGLRGEPQDFRIPRTGDRDLAFRGWLLSHAEERGGSPGLTRGVDIDIYLTIRLRLVAHLCRWSLREGEALVRRPEPQAHRPRPLDLGSELRRLPQLSLPGEARGPPRQHALPAVQWVLRDRLERIEPRCRVAYRDAGRRVLLGENGERITGRRLGARCGGLEHIPRARRVDHQIAE